MDVWFKRSKFHLALKSKRWARGMTACCREDQLATAKKVLSNQRVLGLVLFVYTICRYVQNTFMGILAAPPKATPSKK